MALNLGNLFKKLLELWNKLRPKPGGGPIIPPDPKPPEPEPEPPKPIPPPDAVPFDSIKWVGVLGGLEGYVVNKTVNFQITSITNPQRPTICWTSNIPSTWKPDPSGLTKGNIWVIIRYNQSLWGAPIEWLLTSQGTGTCSTMENIPPQPPFIQGKGEPVRSYVPRSGEEVWFLQSSLTSYGKLPAGAPRERGLIVKYLWP